MAREMKIAVAGAGIGGLALARGLSRAGFGVTVFERQPGPSEVGAGITLWRNALSGLDWLGLGRELAAIASEPQQGVFATAGGSVLAGVELSDIPPDVERPILLTFHRQDLQRMLLEALPEGMIRFGAPLQGYEETERRVLCHVGGRDPEEFDLLIGADGIASTVRSQLLGPTPPRYAGYTCFRGITPIPAGWTGPEGEFWGKGDRVGLVTIGGERLYWFAVANAPAQQRLAPEEIKPHLLRRFGDYAFDIPRIIDDTDDAAILHNDILDRPPTRPWSRGRVALLGDAIHPTTPNMGQGAAMAIESAVVLTRALEAAPDAPASAFAAYERARYPRTRWVTRTSWKLGRMAHWSLPPMVALRSALASWTPSSIRTRPIVRVVSHDPARIDLETAAAG